MLSPDRLAPLFKVCLDIANEVSDEDGFVRIGALIERFHTTLRLRPLLVEGMMGSRSSGSGATPEWTVLIDSERYPDVEGSLSSERYGNPLPHRFRFTVAHELAHSLAFRSSEFGIALEGVSESAEGNAALVKAIEQNTDRLAPLLLCAEKSLTGPLLQLKGPVGIDFLTALRRNHGLSREVLLGRLALSRSMDRAGHWQRLQLREFGLAIGEWTSGEKATLRHWPVFLNFSRSVPKGLLQLQDRDRVPFDIAFGRDALAALKERGNVAIRSRAGTRASPEVEEMAVELEIEKGAQAVGSSFLVLVRDSRIHGEIDEFDRVRATLREARRA